MIAGRDAMQTGWVKLHRKSIDSRVFSDAELWKLWTWCLMRANHADRYFEGELIPRGSFVTGTRSAAATLGSSPATIHRRLKRLSEFGMTVLEVKRGFTIVSICHFDTYNGGESDDETPVKRKRNATETPMKPARNADETTVKPNKNYQELQELGEGENTPLPPKGEPVPQLPPSIRSPEMLAAVESWIAYKAERRERYKPQGLKALYARIANVAAMHGTQCVIDRMERAKASGWKGWDHGESPTKPGLFGDPDDPRGNMAAGHAFLRGST